jgi:hypothetical protein
MKNPAQLIHSGEPAGMEDYGPCMEEESKARETIRR